MKFKIIHYLNHCKFHWDEFMDIVDPMPVSNEAATKCAIYHNMDTWWDAMRDQPVDSDWHYYHCHICGDDKTECTHEKTRLYETCTTVSQEKP